jgi:hypothetical protein
MARSHLNITSALALLCVLAPPALAEVRIPPRDFKVDGIDCLATAPRGILRVGLGAPNHLCAKSIPTTVFALSWDEGGATIVNPTDPRQPAPSPVDRKHALAWVREIIAVARRPASQPSCTSNAAPRVWLEWSCGSSTDAQWRSVDLCGYGCPPDEPVVPIVQLGLRFVKDLPAEQLRYYPPEEQRSGEASSAALRQIEVAAKGCIPSRLGQSAVSLGLDLTVASDGTVQDARWVVWRPDVDGRAPAIPAASNDCASRLARASRLSPYVGPTLIIHRAISFESRR